MVIVKNFLISMILITLIGCGATSPPRVEIVEVKVPIPYVIAPPTVQRPELQIFKLSENDKKVIGKVSQAYAVDMVQITQYITLLEGIINKYSELSKKNSISIQVINESPISEAWAATFDVKKEFDNMEIKENK